MPCSVPCQRQADLVPPAPPPLCLAGSHVPVVCGRVPTLTVAPWEKQRAAGGHLPVPRAFGEQPCCQGGAEPCIPAPGSSPPGPLRSPSGSTSCCSRAPHRSQVPHEDTHPRVPSTHPTVNPPFCPKDACPPSALLPKCSVCSPVPRASCRRSCTPDTQTSRCHPQLCLPAPCLAAGEPWEPLPAFIPLHSAAGITPPALPSSHGFLQAMHGRTFSESLFQTPSFADANGKISFPLPPSQYAFE